MAETMGLWRKNGIMGQQSRRASKKSTRRLSIPLARSPYGGYIDLMSSADSRVALGEAIVVAVNATGDRGKLWTTGSDHAPHVRVYVTRGGKPMGYIEVLESGALNYNGLDRNKAGIRRAVETAMVSR